MRIQPRDTSIKELFESAFLIIPRFQRPYSWDKENVNDFWADVFLSEDRDYFIGPMVFYQEDERSSDIFVVDGQQRLITITILLCVVRDIFLELGEKDFAEGIQRIIQRTDIANRPRYTLFSQTPYPFFQDHIQNTGEPELEHEIGPEEETLRLAYDDLEAKARAELEKVKTKAGKVETLERWRDKALSLHVIRVQLASEEEAYMVFETLNSRGKDLQISDLVKNHVTRNLKVSNRDNDSVRFKWEHIQKVVGRSATDLDINTFIVHHWISENEYLPEKKIFKRLKEKITKQKAKGYLDTLYREVEIYRSIFEPSSKEWSKEERKIVDSLRGLNTFRVRQLAPFLLAIFSGYEGGKFSLRNLSNYLRKLENFHFKFTAITSQRGAGGIAMMYSKAARDFRAAGSENDRRRVCEELCSRFDSLQPELLEFKLGFEDVRYSQTYTRQRALARYILERFFTFENKTATHDLGLMNIEHILSQSEKVAEETIASMGNLILVPTEVNAKLKNKSFEEKKKIMKKHHLKLDPVLEAADKWGEPEVQARLNYLAEHAYNNVWKL